MHGLPEKRRQGHSATMRWPLAVLALALAAPLLAGCTAGSDGVAPTTSGPPPLAATATTGVIRGVVVDEAIRPLANATVTARGPGGEDRTAVTGPDGFFGFTNLVPGGWFVLAHKRAYTDVQQNTEVQAGVPDPPVVKLQVTLIPGQVPFVNTMTVDAFIECIVPGANVCTIANVYPCVFLGYCDNVTDDTSFILFYEPLVSLQRVPDWFQTELVWQTTQSVSDGLGVRFSAHEPADGTGIDERRGSVGGRSPLTITLNQTTATTWETGTKKGVSFEIFGWTEALSPLGSAGFVLNQRVSFYFNVFYGYTPPDGWTFAKDGTVPPPPQ